MKTGVQPSEWKALTRAERQAFGPASQRIKDEMKER